MTFSRHFHDTEDSRIFLYFNPVRHVALLFKARQFRFDPGPKQTRKEERIAMTRRDGV
jgi:hypothetical protein